MFKVYIEVNYENNREELTHTFNLFKNSTDN